MTWSDMSFAFRIGGNIELLYIRSLVLQVTKNDSLLIKI